MKNLLKMCGVVAALSCPVWAHGEDGRDTSLAWDTWEVFSSEQLVSGRKYNAFPLLNLVDGRADTAWVWSGDGKCYAKQPLKERGNKYWISFTARRDVRADALWIRTGFDKETLWKRNNRVAKLRFVGSFGSGNSATFKEFEKTVTLSDRRGWHKIALPTRQVGSIRINLLDFYRGRDGDVAISEVALAYQGRQIPWRLPAAVLVSDGEAGEADESCKPDPRAKVKPQPQGFVSVSSRKTVFAPPQSDADWDAGQSESGRYISGLIGRGARLKVWVFDLRAGRLVWNRPVAVRGAESGSFEWNGDRLELIHSRDRPGLAPAEVRRTVFRG